MGARGALSIVDQALISGGNFASGVILARALATTDFGLFIVANFGLLLALALQNGLTLQPLVVHGATLPDPAFRRFLRASLPIQAMFITASCALIAAAALLWEPLRPFVLPLVAAAALSQAQEFCRRALYTRGHVGAAVLNNIVNYDLQALLLLGAVIAGGPSLLGALWIVALTSGLAVLLGLCQLQRFATPTADDLRTVLHQTLHIGKWTAASQVVSVASIEAFPALVTLLAGLPSTAGLGVMRQMIGPLRLLTRPLENYHLPRAAHAFAHQGTDGLNRVLWHAALLTTPTYVLFLAAIAITPEAALGAVYGDKYASYGDILRVLAFAKLVDLPTGILALELNVRHLQRCRFVAEMWTAAVVYSVGLVLVAGMGLLGAVITIAVSSVGRLAIFACVTICARLANRPAPLTSLSAAAEMEVAA